MDAKFLKRWQVEEMTSLPRSTMYDKINKGDFPRQIRLGVNSVAWHRAEVEEWMASRPRAVGNAEPIENMAPPKPEVAASAGRIRVDSIRLRVGDQLWKPTSDELSRLLIAETSKKGD